MSYKVEFIFEDEDLSQDFLAWMSDGGGEQGFETNEYYGDFDYLDDTVIVRRIMKNDE